MNFIKIFISIFIIIYLLYLFTVILNRKKRNKIFETNQAKLIIKQNNLDTDKLDTLKFCHAIALANSFIVAVTFTVSEIFTNFIIKLLISFVLLIILIFIVYKLVGIILKKRGK